MCNLIEYSSNYSNTTGSLWFYSKDEAVNLNDIIANIYDFTSFRFKAKLFGNTVAYRNNSILKKCNNRSTIKISK